MTRIKHFCWWLKAVNLLLAINLTAGCHAARLDGYERRLLLDAIQRAGGSVAEAARRLRTDRANLYRRMRRLGIEPHG